VRQEVPADIRIEIISGSDFDLDGLGIDEREIPGTRHFFVYSYKNPATKRSVKVLECSFCGMVFRKWHNFFDHLRVHTKERPFKCTETGCELAFT
jgi:hypothetical protein